MNPLHQALAILAKAQNELDADYALERLSALQRVDDFFSPRLRALDGAKKAIQRQLDARGNREAEVYWHLHDAQHHDIQRETNNKIRRSLRRERSAKELKR